MVSVTTTLPQGDSVDEQDIHAWLLSLKAGLSPDAFEKLSQASELAIEIHREQREESGESSLRHALGVADILVQMGLDWETLAAAILHDVLLEGQVEASLLEERFGSQVARMVGDMARIGDVIGCENRSVNSNEDEHIENLRRMLLNIAHDIRVVLIVLAERLHEMRGLKHLPPEIQRREAKETEEIYAPLANRLGIWHIKWELEDLSFRFQNPDSYKDLAKKLDGKRVDRERYIKTVIELLQKRFKQQGIDAEISGRPKHIYSIWKKMSRKSVDFDQIFDLRAVRVLVNSVADCYAALGVTHGLWHHIPGEFDDYIATPKSNGYSSIHTAVIGPEGKTLEIQIRTGDMHQHAELGVAAHWRYKESGKADEAFERRISQMRSWLESKDASSKGRRFVEELQTEFESQQVYVLTPQGKVVELPLGSTPIDFAYAIHSSVGHRCRGARVNGNIQSLTKALKSGQTVEILTTKEGGPSRDWLSPHVGYIKTSRARNRVRQWFKHQDYETHLSMGRSSLEREIQRLGVRRPDLDKAVERFNFKKSDDLLAAIGRGEVSPIQVAGMGELVKPIKHPESKVSRTVQSTEGFRGDVMVEGVGDLLTNMARCCKPVPYDDIEGFITKGKGVSVHRKDCATLKNLHSQSPDRICKVSWLDQQGESTYPVDIKVIANDRKGLLRDLTSILATDEVDVLGLNTHSNRKQDQATMRFTVEISNMHQLSRILDKIGQLPDVLEVKRQI